jgi:heat shock protein HslJ
MKKIAASICTSGLLVTAMACHTSDGITNPDTANADPSGAWALVSFELADGSSVPVPDPSSYTLDLGFTEAGRAHVRADCNLCSGEYRISGPTITFGLMACTLVGCPPGSLENDFQAALASTTTFQRSANVLLLDYDGGVMRLEAREAPSS